MDMSEAKFGPPSRKKRKEQDATSRTDSGPISSTCDRNSTVSPTVTFNNPYKYVQQIIPILSPASVKRLADFNRDVLILGSEDSNAHRMQ